MDTLDVRESRSSLAGVLMAAAFEGVAAYDFARDLVPHLSRHSRARSSSVLSRVDLPAIPSGGLGVANAAAAEPSSPPLEPAAPAQVAGEFKAITPDQVVEARTAASSGPIDPSQFGAEGTGGSPSAQALALLHNKQRDTRRRRDLPTSRPGRWTPASPRCSPSISRDHRITVSATTSDHDRLTSGGSVSNHFYGRAVDIASVDGQPVGPGNEAARAGGDRAVAAGPEHPPERDRLAVGAPRARLTSPTAPTRTTSTSASTTRSPRAGRRRRIPAPIRRPRHSPTRPHPRRCRPTGDDSSDGDDGSDGDDSEPGGLEDPGGDTDAEADAGERRRRGRRRQRLRLGRPQRRAGGRREQRRRR